MVQMIVELESVGNKLAIPSFFSNLDKYSNSLIDRKRSDLCNLLKIWLWLLY